MNYCEEQAYPGLCSLRLEINWNELALFKYFIKDLVIQVINKMMTKVKN